MKNENEKNWGEKENVFMESLGGERKIKLEKILDKGIIKWWEIEL